MIRRPLNERFADKVLRGVKVTTIRDRPWPLGVPIMLFRWADKPYRSKQIEIAPVWVHKVEPIEISHDPMGARFSVAYVLGRPLFGTEGFESHRAMERWFESVVPLGQTSRKHLMQFRLYTPQP